MCIGECVICNLNINYGNHKLGEGVGEVIPTRM